MCVWFKLYFRDPVTFRKPSELFPQASPLIFIWAGMQNTSQEFHQPCVRIQINLFLILMRVTYIDVYVFTPSVCILEACMPMEECTHDNGSQTDLKLFQKLSLGFIPDVGLCASKVVSVPFLKSFCKYKIQWFMLPSCISYQVIQHQTHKPSILMLN